MELILIINLVHPMNWPQTGTKIFQLHNAVCGIEDQRWRETQNAMKQSEICMIPSLCSRESRNGHLLLLKLTTGAKR